MDKVKKQTLYFAYGSNMNGERMKLREIKYSSVQVAKLPNYQLMFNKKNLSSTIFGYANIDPQIGAKVWGILYTIDNSAIFDLDLHEGCPNHYTRELVEVEVDGEKLSAYVYIANEKIVSTNLRPAPSYLHHLLNPIVELPAEQMTFIRSFEKKQSSSEWLFVYGTLMTKCDNHHYLSGYTPKQAYVPGLKLFAGPGYPYATPSKKDKAHGELYKISKDSLQEVDALEGHPNYFHRVKKEVVTTAGEKVDAWVYIKDEVDEYYPIVPNGSWSPNDEYDLDPDELDKLFDL